MNPSDNLSNILRKTSPWENNTNSVWLASTVSLCRNIEKFKFPGKLDTERRKQIINLLSKELLSIDTLKNPFLLRAEEISPLEKEFLVEHFLCNLSFNQAHVGEAFVLDQEGQFIAALNLGNHLHLQYIDCQGELESIWNKLLKIEMKIGQSMAYSFSHKFGFLTSDFSNCGTGLIVSIFLQLSALVHNEKLGDIIEKQADDSIMVTGIQGNPTEVIGDVVVIQNNYTLGVSEENIISGLRSLTTKLLVEENAARNQIRHAESAEIKDKVSRAFGILIHSYQIEAVEALNAISLLKLGADMGWIEGITQKQMNQLFFNCRRSHLLGELSEKISQDEITHKRAEYIHKSLKDAHLTI